MHSSHPATSQHAHHTSFVHSRVRHRRVEKLVDLSTQCSLRVMCGGLRESDGAGGGGAAVVQILSAVERVDEVTGELFYDIDVNIKSFADNNQVRAVCMCE